MIDFHSHIIYAIDDGSKNLDMSIEMLKTADSEGVEYICATPHFITEEFEFSHEEYIEKLDRLVLAAREENLNINILSGLEIYMHPDLPKLYKEKKIWGINDSEYLLIELPMGQFPLYTEDVFYELMLLGAKPILAHPERNLRIMKNYDLVINLINQGVLMQINSGSLLGDYGKEVKKTAEEFVKRNMIHLMGSDGHNITRRKTKIKEAYAIIKRKNQAVYNWIAENQTNIINNVSSLEVLEIKLKKEKGKISFLSFIK
ncbi:PHP domain-containing protein [Clostridium estertheticum]|uniref:tyrosine-protein phosphatase n=1 Tax=Clostridium estertheticum TaxID=238834 RepID=UPI0013EE580B|nr:CpsB/CapC family capsule biosynthesis tyrosine phosphatase [Clostridium estertheticum]MBZ9607785.1 PHP domain-containing protein [Clostridium estertheticum]